MELSMEVPWTHRREKNKVCSPDEEENLLRFHIAFDCTLLCTLLLLIQAAHKPDSLNRSLFPILCRQVLSPTFQIEMPQYTAERSFDLLRLGKLCPGMHGR